MRRHAFDTTAFIWGIVFILVAGIVILREYTSMSLDVKWLVPATFIVLGAAGIARALRGDRRSLP